MAKLLESQIRKDPHFEIPAQRHLGLVVFALTVFKTAHCALKRMYFDFNFEFELLKTSKLLRTNGFVCNKFSLKMAIYCISYVIF